MIEWLVKSMRCHDWDYVAEAVTCHRLFDRSPVNQKIARVAFWGFCLVCALTSAGYSRNKKSQAITWLCRSLTRRERRAWNPHRLRRIYAEFQAVSVCLAENSCCIKLFTWHKFFESSHDRRLASTHSRTATGRSSYCTLHGHQCNW
jgi:hypothetical protein